MFVVNHTRRERVSSQLHLSDAQPGELTCMAGNDVKPDTQLLIRLLPAEESKFMYEVIELALPAL